MFFNNSFLDTRTNAGANPGAASYYSSKELRAVASPMPEYPRRARLKAMEGYTLVEFTVMPDGSVAEPAIAETSYLKSWFCRVNFSL